MNKRVSILICWEEELLLDEERVSKFSPNVLFGECQSEKKLLDGTRFRKAIRISVAVPFLGLCTLITSNHFNCHAT